MPTQQEDPDEIARIKHRFETKFLPKYGGLWLSMIQSSSSSSRSNSDSATKDDNDEVPRSSTTMAAAPETTPVDFLGAIQTKRAITLAVPSCRNNTAPDGSNNDGKSEPCECCVNPILVDSDIESSLGENDNNLAEEEDVIDFEISTNQMEGSTPCPSPIGVGQGFEEDDNTETECSDEEKREGTDEETEDEEDDNEDEDGSHSSGSTVIHFDLSAILQPSPPKREHPSTQHYLEERATDSQNTSDASTVSEASKLEMSARAEANLDSPFKTNNQRISMTEEKAPRIRADSDDATNELPPTRLSSRHVIDLVDSDSEGDFPISEDKGNNSFSTARKKKQGICTRAVVAGHLNSEGESEEEEWNGALDDEGGLSLSSGPKEGSTDHEIEDLVKRTEVVILSDSDDGISFDSPPSICEVDSLENIDHKENRSPEKRNGNEKRKLKSKGMSKASFRRTRESVARAAFSEFDRKAFGSRLASVVDVEWSTKLRTTAGLTRLKRSRMNMRPGVDLDRTASIELSTKVLDDTERLRSTLLHEMVHAAAWVIDGVSKPPHGTCFKRWAKQAMRRIPDVTVTTTHNYEIEYKYAWACTVPGCDFVVKRHSRSVDLSKHCCGKCKGRLVEINVPQGSNRGSSGIDRTPRKKAPASGYNLFVKEHSKSVRKRLMADQRAQGIPAPRVAQSDVMKECAKLWREQKASN